MTDEDVIPVWARKAIGATGEVLQRGSDGRFIRATTALTLKLRGGVCAPCNNGWMSRLEKRVAPWLSPSMRQEDMVLAKPQTDIVAFWAAKTALLIELANRATQPARPGMYAPVSNLRWLYDRREAMCPPPPGTYVWVGAMDPHQRRGSRGQVHGFIQQRGAVLARRPTDRQGLLVERARARRRPTQSPQLDRDGPLAGSHQRGSRMAPVVGRHRPPMHQEDRGTGALVNDRERHAATDGFQPAHGWY